MIKTPKYKKWINFFFFTDVTRMMKSLHHRQACVDDLTSFKYIKETLEKSDAYPDAAKMRIEFCQSPLLSLVKFEKNSFLYMLFLHTVDILASLCGIYFAMQVLATFEVSSILKYKLISFFFTNPTWVEQLSFATVLSIIVLCLNLLSASVHAQKVEREMLLEWRIPIKMTQAIYHFLLNISAKDREKYKTGDVTNLVQNDGRFIASFLAHGLADLIVIVIACLLITLFLMSYVGQAAWFGVGVILLQIPISLFFAWLGACFHKKRMLYGDERIHQVTELIQGMRLLRYLNWGGFFSKEIRKITNQEFLQDAKQIAQFCVSFAITMNLWMFISIAIFVGYLLYSNGVREASILFGVMWLAKLFGQQIMPLPWFFHTLSQSFVASKRLKKFFLLKTQNEEFSDTLHKDALSGNDRKIVEQITKSTYQEKYSVGFEFDHVYFRYLNRGDYILNNVSCEFGCNETVAILGPVGAGKSTFLKILLGEYLPTKGVVYLKVFTQDRCIKLNLHSQMGVNCIRAIQSFVPQESFIVTSTIRENVMFCYEQEVTQESARYDNYVMNSLYQASLTQDLEKFPDRLETEIGERGVNLSGGQKQRISLARKFYKNSHLILMDDPFSAVDSTTEQEMAKTIFSAQNKSQKTIIWTTHRLEHLSVSDRVLVLEKGQICER